MLRNVILDDADQRAADCERVMIALQGAVLRVRKFREYEAIQHYKALEAVRDRLSEILDKAEGK